MGRALSRPLRVSGRPISNFPQFLNKGALKAYRISRSRKRLVAATRSAPHLTRETFSGRRPVDGADTLGGVFRPGENLALGRGEDKVCGCRLNPSLISEVPYELSSAMHFTERERAPQTLSSPAVPTHNNLPRDERLIYTPHHPVRWPYRRRPHLLN